MGLLMDGEWKTIWYDTKSTGGKFVRSAAGFRNWITPDGTAGPSGEAGFKAESGRYHLYVSYACPWAHRTLIFRALKGLSDHISVSVVHPDMLDEGWTFETDSSGATGDNLFGLTLLRDVYLKADPSFTGRVTVPVLWAYKRELYQIPDVAETVNIVHFVRHYHYSHTSNNPHRIIPINPEGSCLAE